MIRLTERLAVLSVKPLRLNFKKRLFFGGSNRCDAFVNVPLEFDFAFLDTPDSFDRMVDFGDRAFSASSILGHSRWM